MPKSTKKRRRRNMAGDAIQLLTGSQLLMGLDAAAMMPRVELAMAVAKRGELPKSKFKLVARSLRERTRIVGGTAIIPLTGAIWPTENIWTKYYGDTACSELLTAIQAAAGDSRVTRILIHANTPGGSVIALEETAAAIFALRSQKRIDTMVEGLLASAGYYVGSSGHSIIASPSASVGSIGTIYHHADWSGRLEDFGVKYTAIHFGQHKDDGSPYRELDAQGQQTLQDWVNSYGDQFVAAVIRNRGVSRETVMQKFGQGKVFIAEKALQLGMIDRVATFAEVLQGEATDASDSTKALDQNGRPSGYLAQDPLRGQRNLAVTLDDSTITPIPGALSPIPPANATTHPAPVAGNPPTPKTPGAGATQEKKTVEKIKALLYALEMTNAADASDEVCDAAIAGYCKSKGVDVPESEQGKIDLLLGSKNTSTNNVQEAHDREQAEAAQFTAADFQAKRDEVAAAADLINAGRPSPIVTAEAVEQASQAFCKGEKTIAQIQAGWRDAIKADDTTKPVRVDVTGSGAENLTRDAEAVLLQRCGFATAEESKLDLGALSGAPILEIADQLQRSVTGHGLDGYNPEARALAALSEGRGVQTIGSIHGASYNRPGDFASMLSNIAGKILDRAIPMARVTYSRWTNRMLDVPNFQLKTIIGAGVLTDMDAILDDEKVKQLAMSEELKGWFQVDRFANKVGLTPVMMANNDLDGFVQQLASLSYAHENTLNSLCLELLTGNGSLADNIALFHASHGNLETGGGAPSAAQAKKMRLKHRKQTGIGTDKKINSQPDIVLVPSDLEDEAKQTYFSIERLAEAKVAQTDANINVHRGSVRDVVVEPDLDDTSTSQWYTIDSMLRTIVHGFQSGYGRGGKRTSWFDNETETRYVKLEGRFGAAAVGYRGICRNNG